ncbi:glycosyltransferase [Candidatus Laterigemmans baculatus]|uniref:glycosyltransferase n=1 Tax=Candidatus Laterigemmans baculatus TaxID=2770505 RepID=UPI0013DA0BB2|nr:glycosyltransferase [Candidatus Laterigemmans baculatus]
MKVAFVVPACNEERHLARCLAAIREQSVGLPDPVAVSLVVVDNASEDATVKIARRYGARVVQVLPGNAGRARNAGARISDADAIAFVDADCVLPPGWLQRGLEHLAEPRVVAVGSVQAQAPCSAPWVERVWVESLVPQLRGNWETVPWLPAFNLLVRKAVFDEVGGFDESLTTCEDSDLTFRLAQRGELRRDHQCPVLHLGESQSLTEFFRREMWRSRGNFRSAWKRGARLAEFPSLVVPLGYVALLACTLAALAFAVAVGRQWWLLTGVLVVCCLVVPSGIAWIKRSHAQRSALSGVLFATYLLARGLGPFLPARRVEAR